MAKSPKIPAYQLHKASGRAFVKFTTDGKRRTVYLGEHDSQESRVAYARVIADKS